MSKVTSIEEYSDSLTPKNKELINKLRFLIKKTFNNVVEQINPWGSLTVSVNGKEIVWFGDYTNHVNLGFFQGAKLHSDLLEGTGKNFRHIKIKTPADIKEETFVQLLKQASELD